MKTLFGLLIIILGIGFYYLFNNKENNSDQSQGREDAAPIVKPVEKKTIKVNQSLTVDDYITRRNFKKALDLLDKTDKNLQNDQWKLKKVEVLDGLGQKNEALALLDSILKNVGEGKKPELLRLKASILEENGFKDKSGIVLYQLVTDYPESELTLDAALKLEKVWSSWLKDASKAQQLPQYNKVLAYIMENSLDDASKDRVYKTLERVNARIFFSPNKYEGLVDFHTVKYGEYLSVIAKKHKIYSERIRRINNLKNANDIRSGQNLRIIMGRTTIKVFKSTYTMHVYIQDLFFKRYRIGIGKNNQTPVVATTISKSRAKNPTWTDPVTGRLHGPEDLKNPIGSRWIGLSMGQGYGIHGTREPESIGFDRSNGCIRMLNQEVEELYDYSMVGDEVTIDP